MRIWNYKSAKIGEFLPDLELEPISRANLALYAGASGDYNPLHSDEIFTTKVVGYPSVFAHGMLSMGLTGKMLTNYVGDASLKKFGVRFTNQVWPGDTLTSKATVMSIREENGETLVDLNIETTNQDDVTVITGSAVALAK